jgi:hypothetical protein
MNLFAIVAHQMLQRTHLVFSPISHFQNHFVYLSMQMRFFTAAILLQLALIANPVLAQDKANSRSHERAENFVILNDSTIVTTTTMEYNGSPDFETRRLKVTIDGGKVYKGNEIVFFKKGKTSYTRVGGVGRSNFARLYKDGRIKLFICYMGKSDGIGYTGAMYYQLDSEEPQLLFREMLIDTFAPYPKYVEKAKKLRSWFQSDKQMIKLIQEFNEEFPVK